MKKIAAALIILMAIGGLLYFSGFAEGFMSAVEGHAGLPSCTSPAGQEDVQRAIGNSPLGKTYGVAIVAITGVKTISADRSKVDCSALAILNSAQKGGLHYSFSADASLGGKYYVHALIDTSSLAPYP